MPYETELEESVAALGERMLFSSLARAAAREAPFHFFASVEVTSPSRLSVFVAVSEESARAIAKLLAPGDELSDEGALDLVSELANTIAGGVARSLSEEAHIELSPPRSGKGPVDIAELDLASFASDDLEILVAARPSTSSS